MCHSLKKMKYGKQSTPLLVRSYIMSTEYKPFCPVPTNVDNRVLCPLTKLNKKEVLATVKYGVNS